MSMSLLVEHKQLKRGGIVTFHFWLAGIRRAGPTYIQEVRILTDIIQCLVISPGCRRRETQGLLQ